MTAQGPKGRSYGGATKRISPRTRCESYGRVPPVDSSGGASDRPPLDEWGGLRSGFSLEAPHPTYYKTLSHDAESLCVGAPTQQVPMATECDARREAQDRDGGLCRLSEQNAL